jgi:hypothetical protein
MLRDENGIAANSPQLRQLRGTLRKGVQTFI